METEGAECADQAADVREHLDSIKTLAEKTVNQVRDLALLLRPSMLDDLGLAPALNWHARETSKRTGLNVMVSADDTINSLPDEHRTCIYRLVQEAVNNAVRHANARTVEVSVRKERQQVNVTVQDDGPGGAGTSPGRPPQDQLRAGARDHGPRGTAGGRAGPKEWP